MNEWVSEGKTEWMNKWMNEWMNECTQTCSLTRISCMWYVLLQQVGSQRISIYTWPVSVFTASNHILTHHIVTYLLITIWLRQHGSQKLNTNQPKIRDRHKKTRDTQNTLPVTQPPRSTQPGHPSVGRRNEYTGHHHGMSTLLATTREETTSSAWG